MTSTLVGKTVDDVNAVEVYWTEGTGYGVAIVELDHVGPWPDKAPLFSVVLINEDPGEILAELRRFAGSAETAMGELVEQVQTAIHGGRGDDLLRISQVGQSNVTVSFETI